jgi:hypothetical protein
MNADETGMLIKMAPAVTRSSSVRVATRALVSTVFVISAVLVAPLQTQSPIHPQATKMRDNLVQAPKWKSKSIKVYRGENPVAVDAAAKEADYEFRTVPGSIADAFHFPVTSECQHVRIGPSHEVYIDTSSGVIGLRIGSATIRWMESLLDPERDVKVTLDKVISEFHETAKEASDAETTQNPRLPPNQIGKQNRLSQNIQKS